MKQIVVEYIEEYLKYKGIIINDKNIPQVLVGLINEAKEMERQQQDYSEKDMKEAFEYGIASGIYQVEKGKNGSMDFEQFIEKFKNK